MERSPDMRAESDEVHTEPLSTLPSRYFVDDFLTISEGVGTITPYALRSEEAFKPLLETFEVPPSGTFQWYINGTQGDQVTNEAFFVESNGHKHSAGSNDPQIVGTMDPSSFVLSSPWPQNVIMTHKATDFCGTIGVKTTFVGRNTDTDYLRVRKSGLVALRPHPALRPYTNDLNHPDCHYGTPALNSAIHACASAFKLAFPNDFLWINDMSLPWGGIFDIHSNHTGPHNGHKWGGEVDISYIRMSAAHHQWFRNLAPNYFTSVVLHGSPLHWHCSVW